MSTRDAVTAVKRFGLGMRYGGLAAITPDPRGHVLAQLRAGSASAGLASVSLRSSTAILTDVDEVSIALREARRSKGGDGAAGAGAGAAMAPSRAGSGAGSDMQGADGSAARGSTSGAGGPMPAPNAFEAARAKRGNTVRENYRDEVDARFWHGASTDAPFVERLVLFWSNHFCVSARRSSVRPIAGAYEREVIRPHVLGRFESMLLASARHPAMLLYLDNHRSMGPNSRAGKRRKRGLNENLARELLELHTLGVDGGYSQADVTELARLITGWTVGRLRRGDDAGFRFDPGMHEPGRFTILGRSYGEDGEQAGVKALRDLARHPSTARHIATKLARSFVSDTPPPALVERLRRTFVETEGDLGRLAQVLAEAPEAWEAPLAKVTTPYEYLVSLLRGFALRPPEGELVRLAQVLGQPVWMPPSPKGWPDGNEAWLSSAGLVERLRVAERVGQYIDREADPRAVARALFGEALSMETERAIGFAEAREQGFHLLIMSPEFLRR
jgi:uncharacterized protein (DUF1800 family)